MLGRLMDAIEQGPNCDNTIVVLWSDHGYHHGEKMDWGKHTLWQRTSGVPLIWAGPGISRNSRVDVTVSLIDMYPTFNELCGLGQVKGLDGQSLVPVLFDPKIAIDRNVILPGMYPGEYAIINSNWRYIHYKDNTEELYNVKEDFNEWYNLAGVSKYDEIKTTLKESAPHSFAQPGPEGNKLKLISENQSFYWKLK